MILLQRLIRGTETNTNMSKDYLLNPRALRQCTRKLKRVLSGLLKYNFELIISIFCYCIHPIYNRSEKN